MFLLHAAQYLRTHRLNESAITTMLSAGGLLSNGLKITPRTLQDDKRVTSIANEQLKNGVELPVINQITFDPATVVHNVGKQLKEGGLSYSYLKGDENSLLIFIHNIFNARELIYSVNGTRREFQSLITTGVFYESASTIRTLAIQQEAKRVFVQFVPTNQRLFHILSKKHPLVGHHPFYLPNFPRSMYLDKSLSPVFEITQAIPKNQASNLQAAAGTPLITNSESLRNDSLRLKDEIQENKNQQEKK